MPLPDFDLRFPSIMAPPIWHSEWPPEVVEKLPDVFDQAVGAVFRNCDGGPFQDLSTHRGFWDESDFRKDQVMFNFSPKALSISDPNRSYGHQYSISGYAADMRWMSFGRLMEFVDVSSESMATYSRRLHPVVERWVHKVLSSHNLRTGDPFILTTPKLAREVHANPDCFELFSAMNTGFGPEMNFFDTLALTPKYGLEGHVQHLYHRTSIGLALDSDLQDASYAADMTRRLFIRKTTAHGSVLTSFFAEKIKADRGNADYYFALTGKQQYAAPTATCWTPKDLLGEVLPGLVAELRDLFSAPFARIVFLPEGRVETAEGIHLAQWSWDQCGGLEVAFVSDHWGVKRYGALTANGRRVTLPPEEVVSQHNGWGLFIDIDVMALPCAATEDDAIVSEDLWREAVETPVACSGAAVMEIAMLGAFTSDQKLDLPGLWDRHDYGFRQIEVGVDGVSVLMDLDGAPMSGRLRRVAYGDGRAVAVMDAGRPGIGGQRKAIKDPPTEARFAFGRSDCVGDWILRLVDIDVAFRLTREGRINTADGETGVWVSRGATLWVIGLSQAPLIVASQFVWTDGVWTLSGWCSRGLGDLTSFSLRPATRADAGETERPE